MPFLGVHLPAFRLERCGWDPRVPVVLLATERGAERVQACSPAAREAGVRPGQTLAGARALLPELQVERHDPVAELGDLEALASALGRYTPAVQAVAPDGLLLEVGPGAMAAVRAGLQELGHLCRLVVAEDGVAALALARHLDRDRVVPMGGLAAALAPLPVTALQLPDEVNDSLRHVGIRTIAQLAALPPSALVGRYGAHMAAAHARANGRAAPAAVPIPPAPEGTSFHVEFPDPVELLEAVLFVLAGLVRDLVGALDRLGRAALRVQVRLRLEVGEHPLPVRLGQATRNVDRLFRLLRSRLERVQIASPVVGVGLELLESAPWRPVQPGLLDRAQAAEPLPELCARLQDVLGAESVVVPVPVDTWRPEAAWVPLPWGTAPPRPAPPTELPDPAAPHEPGEPPRPRPALLLPDPIALRVAAAPSGRPRALFLDRTWTPLGPVEGPERLAGEWWVREGWRRDYWRVGLPDGRRAWIYRDTPYADEPARDTEVGANRWFLHGWDDGAVEAPPGSERDLRRAGGNPPQRPPEPVGLDKIGVLSSPAQDGASYRVDEAVVSSARGGKHPSSPDTDARPGNRPKASPFGPSRVRSPSGVGELARSPDSGLVGAGANPGEAERSRRLPSSPVIAGIDSDAAPTRETIGGRGSADPGCPGDPRGTEAPAAEPGPPPTESSSPRPRPRPPHAHRPYAELVCRSNYSFSEGASFPEELVAKARELGLAALALTDRDGVYGSVRFHRHAEDFPVLHGSLLTLRGGEEKVLDGGPAWSAVALVQDLGGWSTLCRLLTDARAQAIKGRAELPLESLLTQNAGLILLARGEWPEDALRRLRDAVGDRLYRAVSRRLSPGEEERIGRLVEGPIPCVATNDVLMHDPSRAALQDVLTCIRLRTTLPEAGTRLQPNAERVLKSPARMGRLFAPWPALLDRTVEIVGRCHFSLSELTYRYPREVVPDGYTPMGWLVELTRRGVATRYGNRPPPAVVRQIEHELTVIERLDFPAYFLTVNDLVRFARERGILCQGRGSAANSAVCYVLGITAVDPARASLLFERFISEERGEPPDIDVDFEHERREEVIQYVYEKYGRHRAAMVNEVIAYRGRMATRDVGKALGFGLDQVDRLAKTMDGWGSSPPDPERIREAGLDPDDPNLHLTQRLVREIQGFPRHTSIHVGGFVISDGPLIDRAPVEPATMENRTVIQWDKNDVDDLGFVKVDVLALGMLTAIRKCFGMMRTAHGVHHDLASVPTEDPAVYDMLCEADSIGVFQVESRAQQGMLPRLRPRAFYDLVVETAIVRPGPIQGGMVHPYLRRRSGQEAVEYVDPRLRPILERTLGVPIFQEQVMAMAQAVGGFTGGEADKLRRAMGAWRRRGGLGELGERLMEGMRRNGIPEEYAQQIFKQIQGFAEYGFPESHAASFAHLVYVSAWQRCHHPAAFCAALINSQPMGFYAPRSLIADVQRHGVEVRPLDVTRSDWDCTLEPGTDGPALRLGLRLIKGLQEEAIRRVEAARRERPLADLPDLAVRAGLEHGTLMALARAGALDPLLPAEGRGARGAAWAVEGLWEGLFVRARREETVRLPEATPLEDVQSDFLTTGLSLRAHPVGLVRDRLTRQGVVPLSRLVELPADTPVHVAGMVSHRQRPGTASGVLFMTLEDETGSANIVVWPKLYERQRRVIRAEPLVTIRGVLQREGEAMSVVARRFAVLPSASVKASSRDFR